MFINFFSNFFREDLGLRNRWWHRLFLVVFITSFLYALYTVWDTPLPKYKAIETLQNRMTTELQLLPELITSNEKIGQYENNLHGEWYEKNEGSALRQPNIYCSRNIAQHIDEVSARTGITRYKGNGASELLTLEDFKSYINSQRANCIFVTYTFNDQTEAIGHAWFLGNDLLIWRESVLASAIYILKQSFYVTLFYLAFAVAYFKIILYVVFGSKQANTKHES